MFSRVPQPLAFAEALLAQFGALSRETDITALLGGFARAVGELSGCELSQLYLLDQTHTALTLNAECRDGLLQALEPSSLPADYTGEQLLQFALCQNRVVSLVDLPSRLHETGFLPAGEQPWLSLLCVPLVSPEKTVEGMVVCATRRPLDLQGFAHPLGQLGSFVLAQLHLLQRLSQPSGEPQGPSSAPVVSGYGLIGRSAAMRETCRLISKVLHNPYTVLLQGETGTGKEVVARAIHEYGPRRAQAFVVQNCAAFPENLLESELFGYRKGAFTGAERDRPGLFDAADGGTLLLDEIGDMPLSLQAKLLRVLQEGEIRPLGGNDTHKVDVRIIAATHRDLALLVRDGKFREDLYYRLAQFSHRVAAVAPARGRRPRTGPAFRRARLRVPAPRAAGLVRGSAGTARRLWLSRQRSGAEGTGGMRGTALRRRDAAGRTLFPCARPRKRRRRSSCASIWSRSNGTCCSPACAGTLATRPSPRANWVCRDEP